MRKYFDGLDATAIQYAMKQTCRGVVTITFVSAILAIAIMQIAIGMVHVVGVVLAIVMPLALSTPTTFFMCLKHQHLRAANKKLQILASTDCLTGTLNRRAFSDNVNSWLGAPIVEHTDAPGALMVIDVDRFKLVNDTFGHEVGDMTLQMLASQMGTSLSKDATIGRIGGEEFAIFIPNVGAAEAVREATKLCRLVSQADFSEAGLDTPISVSVGVAIAAPGTNLHQLMRIADKKLYQAKNEGRNRVISGDPSTKAASAAA